MILLVANLVLLATAVAGKLSIITAGDTRYDPNWDSLDSRPTPEWFDEAKIGIFLHWGLYSVPSFGSEWFWENWKSNASGYREFMEKNYKPGFTYQDFGPQFTAEFYDPKEWAELFEKAGAKYVVLTSKHHEGFTMWPSNHTFSWNAKDLGPNRDLLGELADAIRKNTQMKFGTYYSLYEWFNPLYNADKATNFTQANFVEHKMIPEMMELVNTYKPEVLWVDGDWEATEEYFQSKEFLAWLYNESPVKDTVLVNDRWGIGVPCKHGDFFSCADRFNPGVLQPHKWENAMTIDKQSWGYRRNAKIEDYMTTHELLQTMVETVSCGGNILMNVGPTKEGTIAPIFQQRLTDVGEWLSINGEAIYGSKPWIHQNDTNGFTWYTSKGDTVYAFNLHWPENNDLHLGLAADLFVSSSVTVDLLGGATKLKWGLQDNVPHITFPDKATVTGDWVYVIKIQP